MRARLYRTAKSNYKILEALGYTAVNKDYYAFFSYILIDKSTKTFCFGQTQPSYSILFDNNPNLSEYSSYTTLYESNLPPRNRKCL